MQQCNLILHRLVLVFLYPNMQQKLLSLLTSLVIFQSFAQKDSTTLGKDLEAVVVSANKFEQLQKETARQIEIIDQKEIARYQSNTTATALEQSGKAFVQRSQLGGGSIVLRGFEANRVLLLIDGVRVNNAIFRGGHLQNALRVDPFSLSRMEVLFGSGSVQYGSDALGGVVQFKTKNPEYEKKSVQVNFRGNTAALERTVNVNWNVGKKKWAWYTSLSRMQVDDLRMGKNYRSYEGFGLRNFYIETIEGKDSKVENTNPYIQRFSGYTQYDAVSKLKWRTGFLEHEINLQSSISSIVPRYDRLTDTTSEGSLRFATWSYGPELRALAAYSLKLPAHKWYNKSILIASFQPQVESRITRRLGREFEQTQQETVLAPQFQWDFQKLFKQHSFQYGLEALFNTVRSISTEKSVLDNFIIRPSDTRYPDGGSNVFSSGAYLDGAFKFKDGMTLQAGMRLTYYQLESRFLDKTFFPFPFDQASIQNTAFTHHVGLVKNIQEKVLFKLAWSTAFRNPNVDDMGKVFDSGAGTLVVPNPDLQAEKSGTLEATMESYLARKIRVEANVYHTWLTNALQVRDFTLNEQSFLLFNDRLSRVVAQQNTGAAQIYGAFVHLSWDILRPLKLVHSSTWTKGKTIDNLPMDHIPPFFGKTAIEFTPNSWNTELSVLYNGWKRIEDYSPSGEDNQRYATPDGTPSWWTLNARIRKKMHEKFSFHVAIENILDLNYRVFASGISAPGRNIIASIQLSL